MTPADRKPNALDNTAIREHDASNRGAWPCKTFEQYYG